MLCLSTWLGIGDEHPLRKRDYHLVAPLRHLLGDAPPVLGKWREYEQPSLQNGLLVFGPEAHSIYTSGRAPGNRSFASQQDVKTLFVHRCVESADDANASVAQFLGQIEELEYQFARALDGTEEGQLGGIKQPRVSECVARAASYRDFLGHGRPSRMLDMARHGAMLVAEVRLRSC